MHCRRLGSEQKAFEEFQHSLPGSSENTQGSPQGLCGALTCASSVSQLTARQGQAIGRVHLQKQKFESEC